MAIRRCTTSFSAFVDGAPRVINEGALVEDGDPILAGREHLFETVEAHVSGRAGGPVEQATAAPGEKRTRRKPPTTRTKEQ